MAEAHKVEFDPCSRAVHDDPYLYYRAMREQEPVYYDEKHGDWLVTKWEVCQRVLRGHETSGSTLGPALEANSSAPDGPPTHTVPAPGRRAAADGRDLDDDSRTEEDQDTVRGWADDLHTEVSL